jgi:chaperonin GroES
MTIKPLNDRVLLQRVEEERKSSGGIIIPDTAQEKPQYGIVRAVGEGKRDEDGDRIEPQVQEGDKVLFGKYSGTEITVQGEEHIILGEDDILAIIED